MHFLNRIKNIAKLIKNFRSDLARLIAGQEEIKLQIGRQNSYIVGSLENVRTLAETEFKVFSQFGDDGIIQWLITKINFPIKSFIEFGVEDYSESNTRFLLMNNNWSGLVIDGSTTNVQAIRSNEYYWKHDLTAVTAFLDQENINKIITDAGFTGPIGILHIDIDGNDYWMWEAISTVDPVVVIMEYNSIFGMRPITVPYDPAFIRSEKHYSNLYYGASLRALTLQAERKGFRFIGSNSAGNNAYFVKNEYYNSSLPNVTDTQEHVVSKFRESRDMSGALTYFPGDTRLALIKGLPVWNVKDECIEQI